MTILAGNYQQAYIYQVSTGYNPPGIDTRIRIPNIALIDDEPLEVFGSLVPVLSRSVPTNVSVGKLARSFLQDYYYRVHVNPTTVNVGNLLSTQLKNIEVWNARFLENTLSSIAEESTTGITLSGVVTPTTYAGLQSKVYVANISTNGPATIDAKFKMSFSLEAYLPTLALLGVRILAWFPRPNWDTPLIERWEWLTNVITSRNRKEQRIKLRESPRRQLEYSLLVKNNKERQLVENLLYAWQSRVFGLPIWTDQEFISVQLIAGTTVIPCSTFTRDYVVDGLVALLNETDYEIGTITEVGADYVRINTPLLKTWEAGTKVAPMRTARISDKQSFVRHTDTILGMTVQFKLDEEDSTIPLVETVSYRSYAVLEVKPNWDEEITSEYMRDLTLIDYSTGRVLGDDTSGIGTITHKYHWMAGTRSEVYALKQFLFSRYGKLIPIWVPTFSHDLEVVTTIGSASTEIVVINVTYTRNVAQGIQRRDIRIQLNNGTIFYRRILTSTEDGVNERLILDTSLGILVEPTDIFSVSFMSLCRLEADSIEASWETDSVMLISALFRTLRDDV